MDGMKGRAVNADSDSVYLGLLVKKELACNYDNDFITTRHFFIHSIP